MNADLDPRIPAVLHPLINDFAGLIQQALPGQVDGLYLEGSLALDGFHPRLSDVDFIAILNQPAESNEREALRAAHQHLAQRFPRWQLSGRYLQRSDLGRPDGANFLHLNDHDGRLDACDRFGLASVTGWILKNHGIALFGPDPQALPFTVDMDALIRTQRENLNTYWAGFTTRPAGLLALLTDWGIQWTALGALRQFYTIRERRITTKVKAGEYALGRLPEQWHPIIREAIALRGEPKQHLYQSRIQRALHAHHFLKYIISETVQNCGTLLEE